MFRFRYSLLLFVLLALVAVAFNGCASDASQQPPSGETPIAKPTFTPLSSSMPKPKATPKSSPTSTATPKATPKTTPTPAPTTPAQVATSFYQALKALDYPKAYSYLTANATLQGQHLTESTFIQMAQQRDTSEGVVTDFTLSADSSGNVNSTVIRVLLAYHAHLVLTPVGGGWKIMSLDMI